jgi:NitT/TauT family transport system substrate-binding protein
MVPSPARRAEWRYPDRRSGGHSPGAAPTMIITCPLLVFATVLLAVTACSRADHHAVGATNQGPATELRLGYFPNITHAPALIGLAEGFFTRELGATRLTTQTFNAGPDEVNALLGGSLDAAYIGSGPAINAFAKSHGQAIRLVAGATSGGAQLVVRPDITSPEQLNGKTIATPQRGNTQDIALKKWVTAHHLAVTVTNLDNPRVLDAFRGGGVDGGWLPEPWSSQLVVQAGARMLVDERTLWPDGKFPTTVLVVRTEFLTAHPDTVRALLRGHLRAIDAAADPARATTLIQEQVRKLTGNSLPAPVLERAFANVTLDPDPLAALFPQLAKDSTAAGITEVPAQLSGFLDLRALNAELSATGKPAVSAAGLDKPTR